MCLAAMLSDTCYKEQIWNKMDLKQINNSQRGAMTIVEAAFVFPIMFIIVFMMIMVGEAYYQYARVEFAVNHAAVSGAARCENPMLGYIQKNGNTVPSSPSAADVVPYRYILTGNAQSIGEDVESELTEKIDSMKPLAFKAMSPRNVKVTVTPKLNILVSSLRVECEFDIELPIRIPFSDQEVKFHYVVTTVEPVGDPAEFVRNVSAVQDLLERNKGAQDIFGKIKSAMDELGRFVN